MAYYMAAMTRSEELYRFAQQVLPGGVTASFRLNKATGRPLYIARGQGSRVYDVDGRAYIDMCVSHGASLLGHNHPKIKAAVARALEMGIICSYETEFHAALAQKITEMVPCAELVRFAGSGTETVMHALRLARAATGREKIIKFEGHFHGYADALNYSVSPSPERTGTTPEPESAGMPASDRDNIIIAPFNAPDALEAAFEQHSPDIAALIMEPINYDQGCIPPAPGFLQLCRALCNQYGALLLFDEVLTAFRMAPGGAQAYLGVTPDLCVLGKAFGGGMPISAVAGRRAVMEHMRPLGNSEMSGTYLAHLTTVLAALAALEEYSRPGFYEQMDAVGEKFYGSFQEIIDRSGLPLRLQYVGPRFGLYFGLTEAVTNYRQAARKNQAIENRFIAACIERGVYFHASPHHGFSAAHTEADMGTVLEVIEASLAEVAVSGT
jgi:glutamate-1-semialdehyde 2,1-aminomutase